PTFFTGLVFILVFSLWLDWLPFIYRADIAATGWRWWWEHARQAAMPVAVLGLFQGATLTRFVRSAVLDVIRLDYVNTARAKGLSEGVTVVKHVIRNALIPVVTLVALQIPGIFTGAVITEQIFRIPGIGSLLISSILANDTPVIMPITFVFSCLVVIFNLLADLLYGWLDPRIAHRRAWPPRRPRRCSRAPRARRSGARRRGASAAIARPWSASPCCSSWWRACWPDPSSIACRSTRSTSRPSSRGRRARIRSAPTTSARTCSPGC